MIFPSFCPIIWPLHSRYWVCACRWPLVYETKVNLHASSRRRSRLCILDSFLQIWEEGVLFLYYQMYWNQNRQQRQMLWFNALVWMSTCNCNERLISDFWGLNPADHLSICQLHLLATNRCLCVCSSHIVVCIWYKGYDYLRFWNLGFFLGYCLLG